MKKDTWTFTSNPFDNSTKGSFKKMLIISTYTDATLHAHNSDPAIAPLYTVYHPLHLAYVDKYDLWIESGGLHKGATVGLTDLLAQLSNPLIEDWDTAISQFYHKGSARHTELLPDGHAPFQAGSKETRINAVKSLVIAMGTDTNLTALKVTVNAFYNTLIAARDSQQGRIGGTGDLSALVEAARLACAQGLMKAYGGLVVLYFTDLKKIEPFFDLETIQSKPQKEYYRHITAGTSQYIFSHSFKEADKMKVKNTGTVDLRIFLSHHKTGILQAGTLVPAGSEMEITGSQLGDIKSNRYVIVTNEAIADGSIEIETEFV